MDVHVDLEAIRQNARRVRELVDASVLGVVKGVAARQDVVDAIVAAGIEAVAVSRLAHLRGLASLDAERVMLRLPTLAEREPVVGAADRSLQASVEAVRAAQRAAERFGTTHRVVPLVDAGDHREGIPLVELESFLDVLDGLDRIEVSQIGVNLGCFGDRPDPAAVHRIARAVPDRPLSVGGSGMLLVRDRLPDRVSEFRIGDAILTGRWLETAIEGLHQDAIELEAEVLVSRSDVSVIDVGSVNSAPHHLFPTDGIELVRWSTEQAVVDRPLPVGSSVRFEMGYDAVATAFNVFDG